MRKLLSLKRKAPPDGSINGSFKKPRLDEEEEEMEQPQANEATRYSSAQYLWGILLRAMFHVFCRRILQKLLLRDLPKKLPPLPASQVHHSISFVLMVLTTSVKESCVYPVN